MPVSGPLSVLNSKREITCRCCVATFVICVQGFVVWLFVNHCDILVTSIPEMQSCAETKDSSTNYEDRSIFE